MSKSRLEAYTDAIIAIIITIIILSFQMPESYELSALIKMKFSFGTYILSFLTLSMYWVNHHHMFQIVKNIDGKVLWLNILFLFFVSLFPFATMWLSNYFGKVVPTVFYSSVFMMSNITYCTLSKYLVKINEKEVSTIKLINSRKKEEISIVSSILIVILSYFLPKFVIVGYFIIFLMWLKPSKFVENFLSEN